MEAIGNLFVYAILGLIILFHSWGFWCVYNWSLEKWDGFSIIVRGVMAGLTTWFWLCFAFGLWGYNSGGSYIVIFWFFGLIFTPIIGILQTSLFWGIINKYELKIGILGRAFLGLIVGFLAAVVIGKLIGYFNPNTEGRALYAMIALIAPIGLTSGIMADERKIKWSKKNFKK